MDTVAGYNVPQIAGLFNIPALTAQALVDQFHGSTLTPGEQAALAGIDSAKATAAFTQLSQNPLNIPTTATFAGFTSQDVSAFLGVSTDEASGLINQAVGQPLTIAEQFTLSKSLPLWAAQPNTSPLGGSTTLEVIQLGFQHMAAHPAGSHYHGSFNVGQLFSNFLGVITFGTFPDVTSFLSGVGEGKFNLGKIQANIPFSGAQVNKFSHDVTDFYTVQQVGSTTTPILDSTAFKILDTVAGAVAGAIVGHGLYNSYYADPTAGAAVGSSYGAEGVSADTLTASETFGEASSIQAARLGIGTLPGPTTFESALFGTPTVGLLESLPAAQLGLTTEQLFSSAGPGVTSQLFSVASKTGEVLSIENLGATLWREILSGNLSALGNTLLGVVGLPGLIPISRFTPTGSNAQLTPSPIPVYGAAGGGEGYSGGGGGGGGANPLLSVSNPAELNVTAYVIGAGLLAFLVYMIVKGKG